MNVSQDEVKWHNCYFCSVVFFKRSNIIQHMSIHTMEKPYKCQHCFQSFTKKASLKRHKEGTACNLKLTYTLPNPCYFCRRVLSNNGHANEHMKTVHLKENFKRCYQCNKYFSSTTAINCHIRAVHLLERNYKCQLCFKRFDNNGNLLRHIQSVHTQEKAAKCYFCSKSFVNLGRLKGHLMMHTREKPLTCYFCRKGFSRSNHRSAHMRRIHTKERPFQCIQCTSRSYSTKGAHNVHVRRKHGSRVEQ
jgi:KRAB domain-containing zinc finger protein